MLIDQPEPRIQIRYGHPYTSPDPRALPVRQTEKAAAEAFRVHHPQRTMLRFDGIVDLADQAEPAVGGDCRNQYSRFVCDADCNNGSCLVANSWKV